jgi:acetylornithine/succinyldiaminopimelate/putrescine aminotransferase
MLGIEFAANAKQVQQHLFDKHIITNVTAGEVLRMLPPLIFERKHSDELLSGIESALEEPGLR